MTKQEFFSRFSKKGSIIKVQDAQTFEWVKPYNAYKVKTQYNDEMALYTPIKF